MVSPDQLPLFFITGPSGAGKSQSGVWLAEDLNFLHIEVDRWPEGDGIDLANLRIEWDTFLSSGNAEFLANKLCRIIKEGGKAGAVLTFSSLIVFQPHLIAQLASKGIAVVILYGSGAECLNAFLDRENKTGRRLPAEHWIVNNQNTYAEFSRPEYSQFRLPVFENGDRRSRAAIMDDIKTRSVSNE